MDETKKARLRAQVNRLFKSNPEGSVIELVINDKVSDECTYTIPHNHYVEIDSKPPIVWLNICLCLWVKSGDKVGLRIRR